MGALGFSSIYQFIGGNIIVKQVGHAVLTVNLPGGNKEEYLITLPKLRIEGLWYGSPYIELAETSYISGSNGWLSTVRNSRPDVNPACFVLILG
jgi:hypothetical protein